MKCSYKHNAKRTLGRAIRSQIAEMQLPITWKKMMMMHVFGEKGGKEGS
jgi:hypothetical protein